MSNTNRWKSLSAPSIILLSAAMLLSHISVAAAESLTNGQKVLDNSPSAQMDDQLRLIGTWQLVSGEYLNDKQQWVDYRSLHLSAIKVISASHFSFTTMAHNTDTPTFWAAGAGRYQANGTDYVEYPELNSFNAPVNAAFTFSYRLEGDNWYTQRFEDGVLKEKELWRRIK